MNNIEIYSNLVANTNMEKNNKYCYDNETSGDSGRQIMTA